MVMPVMSTTLPSSSMTISSTKGKGVQILSDGACEGKKEGLKLGVPLG